MGSGETGTGKLITRYDMIECTRGKENYAAWLIPSISARVTREAKRAARVVPRPPQGTPWEDP